MWIAVAIAIGIVLSIKGCATHQAHPDGHVSFDDIAVLHRTTDYAFWGHRPNIRRIDGEEVGYYAYTRFEMLPGKHHFSLVCEPRFSTIYTKWPASSNLEFNMEAGHQYHTFCNITDGKVKYWIKDKSTGAVVVTALGGSIDSAWQLEKDAGIYCPNAENGQADAQIYIGDIYYKGNVIPQDLIHSYVWYGLAARGGNSRAADLLLLITRQLSPDQMAEAKKQLDEWTPGHCQSDLLKAAGN